MWLGLFFGLLAKGDVIEMSGDQAFQCHVCTAAEDHLGNPIGQNNIFCGESFVDNLYLTDCAEDQDVCVTDVRIDWIKQGTQIITTVRRCGKSDEDLKKDGQCFGNYQLFPHPFNLFKDCLSVCSDSGCNNADSYESALDAHAEDIGATEEIECHACQLSEINGEISGNLGCRDGESTVPVKKCPRHLGNSCFTAAEWVSEVQGNFVIESEEDHRGCSAFDFENPNQECIYSLSATGEYSDCKKTCEESKCNTGPLEKRISCITCTGTRLFNGEGTGVGDNNCFELVGGNLNIQECESNSHVCETELEVDWLTTGVQQQTIRRGCTLPNPDQTEPEFCEKGETENRDFMYRDCHSRCDGPQCNVGMNHVQALHQKVLEEEGAPKLSSCQVCKFIQRNDGTVEGDTNCLDTPNKPHECPIHANAGCFTTSSIHFYDGAAREEVYRGCSAFHVPAQDSEWCNPSELGNTRYNVCKKQCTTTNCNNEEHEQPELPIDGLWSACEVCDQTVDQFNVTIGLGNDGCFDGSKSYLKLCENPNDHCVTDLQADWWARGHHTYSIRRYCGTDANTDKCTEGSTATISFKDCKTSCDPHNFNELSGCNAGLEKVSALFAPEDGKGVDSCYTCQYYENNDGTVIGDKDCGSQVQAGSVPSYRCPAYARTSCYHASSTHVDYFDNNNEFTDEFRGCSPFIETRADYCYESNINNLLHRNCRETCNDNNNCNRDEIILRDRCYTCSGTKNSLGEALGVTDLNCFDNVQPSMLQQCGNGEFCADEMLVDWMPRGEQVVQIKRGCVSSVPSQCTEGGSSLIKFKDCYLQVYGDAKNDNLDVGQKFIDPSHQQDSCHNCRYVEEDDGDVSGNQICQEDLASSDQFKEKCPDYASLGCQASAAVHNYEGVEKFEVYKSCSSFFIGGTNQEIYNQSMSSSGQQVDYSITKTTCRGPNCNNKHLTPPPVGEPIPKGPQCLVCTETVDQNNATVGTGSSGCFSGHMKFVQECAIGDICSAHMEIDWFAKGNMQYRIYRNCASNPVPDTCYSGGSSLIQYKDCYSSCDPMVDGPGCNNDLEEIANKFTAGENRVDECFKCEWEVKQDGTVVGNPECGKNVAVGNYPKVSCPRYADTACYWAASFHRDYNDGITEVEEDHRGCSAFELTRQNQCERREISGLDHLNCKETCTDNGCNSEQVVRHLQCHTCQATKNAQGLFVGVSDINCFDYPQLTEVQECNFETEFCQTEMITDWYGRGQQEVTIRRSCASKAAGDCQQGSTERIMYKDCFHTCEDMLCNTGLEVADLFDDGIGQENCVTCFYAEEDDGDVNGNTNCVKVPDASALTGKCPKWAQNGCFTGAAKHSVSTGPDGEREEVYRGCSTFALQAPIFDNATLVGGTEYVISKETCVGEDCNEKPVDIGSPPVSFTCFVCTATQDHTGMLLGTADPTCFFNPGPHLAYTCPNEDDVCIAEMVVDWTRRGAQTATIQRRCGQPIISPGGQECIEQRNQQNFAKDCGFYTPEKNGNGLSATAHLWGLFSTLPEGNTTSCHTCKFGKDRFGNFLPGSNENCQKLDPDDHNFEMECPQWADAACFTAATWHTEAGIEVEEDYKGCSSFALSQEEMYCSVVDIEGEPHNSCKETCQYENCNQYTPQKKKSCFSCTATVDSNNATVGIGSPSCWSEFPDGNLLETCDVDEAYCIVDVESDWSIHGKQTYTVKRGCSKTPAMKTCAQGQSGQFYWKDCADSCEYDGCNSYLAGATDKFAEGMNATVASCYTCDYLENDDGTVDGNVNCGDNPGLIEINGGESVKTMCPPYAQLACYTGTAFHYDKDGVGHEEVYKGCSTFDLHETDPVCDTILENVDEDGNEDVFGVCKQTCTDDNCNEGHQRPCVPGAGSDCGVLSCYTCEGTYDHMNNTVGFSSPNCLAFPSYNDFQSCAPGQNYCIVDIQIDWYITGEQTTRVRRGCSSYPMSETCRSSGNPTSQAQFKDCGVSCEEAGCNRDLDDAARMFIEKDEERQDKCYACQYIENDDGDVQGNKYCADEPDLIDVSVDCPMYAQKACFTGTNVHYNNDGVVKEAVYKGCSTFEMEAPDIVCNNNFFEMESQGQLQTYGVCKQSCNGDNCNKFHERPCLPGAGDDCGIINCYTCEVTVDSNNQTVGFGNPSCFGDYQDINDLKMCPSGTTHCAVDIEVDWFQNGEQQTRIRRGCAPPEEETPMYEECRDAVSQNQLFMYKDCTGYCNMTACNSDTSLAAEKFMTGIAYTQESCFTCKYGEKDDGTVFGNQFCADEPDKLEYASQKCALYNNLGCYTGTNAHYTNEGVSVEEVYKGCSAFEIPMNDDFGLCGIIYRDENPDSNDYEVGACKQFCNDGPDCNKGHVRPCIHEEGNDCPQGGDSSAVAITSSLIALIISMIL